MQDLLKKPLVSGSYTIRELMSHAPPIFILSTPTYVYGIVITLKGIHFDTLAVKAECSIQNKSVCKIKTHSQSHAACGLSFTPIGLEQRP